MPLSSSPEWIQRHNKIVENILNDASFLTENDKSELSSIKDEINGARGVLITRQNAIQQTLKEIKSRVDTAKFKKNVFTRETLAAAAAVAGVTVFALKKYVNLWRKNNDKKKDDSRLSDEEQVREDIKTIPFIEQVENYLTNAVKEAKITIEQSANLLEEREKEMGDIKYSGYFTRGPKLPLIPFLEILRQYELKDTKEKLTVWEYDITRFSPYKSDLFVVQKQYLDGIKSKDIEKKKSVYDQLKALRLTAKSVEGGRRRSRRPRRKVKHE